MNFFVSWKRSIRHELHLLWATASNSASVRTAAETIEHFLAVDPAGSGKHLSEGLWRIVVFPLVIHYTIDTDLRLVEITSCGLTPDNHP